VLEVEVEVMKKSAFSQFQQEAEIEKLSVCGDCLVPHATSY
jgi:hypothetical protein